MGKINIRKSNPGDHEALWEIIEEVILKGDTYVFAPDSEKEEMLAYWCGEDKFCYVAELDGLIAGTFILKDNFPDLGSHVANASYMTRGSASGQGVGYAMGEFSIREAKNLGYHAMQFNLVVKSNERAIRLWKKLGFKVVGEIPEAFRHINQGYQDAMIMWRKL